MNLFSLGLKDGLSIFSTIVSTATALYLIRKNRRERIGRLDVSTSYNVPDGQVAVELTNVSFRPVTVRSICLWYGSSRWVRNLLTKDWIDGMKLLEGEFRPYSISIAKARAAAKESGLVEVFQARLFVTVETTNSGVFTKFLVLPADIIQGNPDDSDYCQFTAAADLIGLKTDVNTHVPKTIPNRAFGKDTYIRRTRATDTPEQKTPSNDGR